MSHSHRAAAQMHSKRMALAILPEFYPMERPSEVDHMALVEWNEIQHQIELMYSDACKTADAAYKSLRDARHLGARNRESMCEQMYALAVMNAMHLQAAADEWSYPTSWTDGQVSEDGFIRVYNDGALEKERWQGEEMNEVKCDLNGMGMKAPY